MINVSLDGGQTPFVIVQTKTVVPAAIAVTGEFWEAVFVIVAPPEAIVQIPVPTEGRFAERTDDDEQIV